MIGVDAFPLKVAPDWGLTDEPTANIEETTLGDGYVLRRKKGINHLRSTWNPSWGMLTKQQADATYSWLKERLSLTAFMWTHPDTGETHKVVCQRVTKVVSEFNNYTMQATFVQDFNL